MDIIFMNSDNISSSKTVTQSFRKNRLKKD